ncbi:hypothetical protein AAF712_003499 [Marasmius tenuissimus]|uniref:Uncharacterized protein n=1 Tax=Marasmius tenuissimus TaxID=585030 RepID=A0ABR3A809_9AGAR
MISMSSPYMNSSYHKQQQYGAGQSQIHLGALNHPHNPHSQQQRHYETAPIQHHAHSATQHQYDMDIDAVYHPSYTHGAQGQQQIQSPTFSPPLGSQHHIQQRLNQPQSESAAVCDPRFVSGHHDFYSSSQQNVRATGGPHPHARYSNSSGTTTSASDSSPSSPAGADGHVDVHPIVKVEGDSTSDTFSSSPQSHSLSVVIPPNTIFEGIRPSTKRKCSSASESSQSGFFDPEYSLVSAVRVELDGGHDGVVSPTALISPLERTELDQLPPQDGDVDNDGYSDADGESEEYEYEDPNDPEFVPRSRPSVPRRTSHQHLSSDQHHSPQQSWLGVPIGRRRAATSPSVALSQTYSPQPSYPWGYSHDSMGSPPGGVFSSNISSSGGAVRHRAGTTSTTVDHSHRYNPYPTAGYTSNASYEAPQSIAHSTSYESSTSFTDELTYPTHHQPTYPPSLELSLHSLRSRRASTSTTTSTTTPNTPLTPLTPLSTGDGGMGVHVHGYSTRSGGVSHSYSAHPGSSYDSSSSGLLNGSNGHLSLHGDGMGGPNKRRSRPSTSLPVPVPVPNLTKKSRGRRVPTVYSSTSSHNSGATRYSQFSVDQIY